MVGIVIRFARDRVGMVDQVCIFQRVMCHLYLTWSGRAIDGKGISRMECGEIKLVFRKETFDMYHIILPAQLDAISIPV